MTLPTSGFQIDEINYYVATEGSYSSGFNTGGAYISIKLEPFTDTNGALATTETENWMAAIEAGLQAMADSLDSLDGVSDVKINLSFSSVKNGGDIRD